MVETVAIIPVGIERVLSRDGGVFGPCHLEIGHCLASGGIWYWESYFGQECIFKTVEQYKKPMETKDEQGEGNT